MAWCLANQVRGFPVYTTLGSLVVVFHRDQLSRSPTWMECEAQVTQVVTGVISMSININGSGRFCFLIDVPRPRPLFHSGGVLQLHLGHCHGGPGCGSGRRFPAVRGGIGQCWRGWRLGPRLPTVTAKTWHWHPPTTSNYSGVHIRPLLQCLLITIFCTSCVCPYIQNGKLDALFWSHGPMVSWDQICAQRMFFFAQASTY